MVKVVRRKDIPKGVRKEATTPFIVETRRLLKMLFSLSTKKIAGLRLMAIFFLMNISCLFLSIAPTEGAPTSFPHGLTINDPTKAYQGYTLYCISGMDKVIVLDMAGNEVHTWNIPGMDSLVKPLPNGRILTSIENKAVTELDWDGNVQWEYKLPPFLSIIHHDFQRLPNGNTLILVGKIKKSPKVTPIEIKDDQIIEVTPAGEIVWRWSTAKHFNQLGLSDEAREIIRKGDVPRDLFHTNSIQSLPPNQYELTDPRFKAGNILVSQRETNLVYIIDKTTRNIVWTLNTQTIGQHHSKMIPQELPGAGNILLFNNGGRAGYPRIWSLFSRVLEIIPPTSQVSWTYNAQLLEGKSLNTFFSVYRSSSQRLANGNTLVMESQWGRIFEVTPLGEIVWEYIVPYYRTYLGDYTNQIYRAYRVDPGWLDGTMTEFIW